ncbi:heterochromatin protein one [Durotheca rogersii]|uniref:heterochromatin protein one n=1 Tax=Durotheca rogersii TaxID=419775 RepID=UPI00221E949B|nr:heterochromatin protein one [Durotheca rogersii]KAI5861330.1 heterochromatin protein one [Durotheca rogersii]
MPPAISDDDASDFADAPTSATRKHSKKPSPNTKDTGADDDGDEEMLDVVKGDIKNGNGTSRNGKKKEEKEEDDGEDEDEENDENEDQDEDLEEDEYIVEKILAHVVENGDHLKFKVKWEGYEKKSDQTWEDEENIRENASDILDIYLAKVGGRDKIIEEANAALKTKKRGRPAGASTNGTKRRRNGSHPDSATPPTTGRSWHPPVGSWEDEVESIDACHDENTGKLIVYLTWKNGHKTQHDTKVIYQRCPQKMLQFYERHVKIVSSAARDGATKEES